ncbi:hypothetical protein GCM10018775_43230 [Streptomyces umbrinus]|nr:hypothetical protein GCM10018775_43230 [Streptomyces umbrinus]
MWRHEGVSFRRPPTELAVGFGRVLRKVCPTVRFPEGSWTDSPQGRWVPGSVGHEGLPDSAEAARPGVFAGAGRAAHIKVSQFVWPL